MEFIWLYHFKRYLKTIKDFMEKEYIYGIMPEDLFKENQDFIFEQMTEIDKNEFKKQFNKYPLSSSDLKVEMILPCPCSLKLNKKNVTAEVAIDQTNFQANTDDYYAFENEKIQDLYQNDGFSAGGANKRAPSCQVLGWFKSLYFLGNTGAQNVTLSKGRDLDNDDWHDMAEFADLSRHIISLSTYVDSNGGSFTIRLPAIKAHNIASSGIGVRDKEVGAMRTTGTQFPHAAKSQYNFGKTRDQYYTKNEIGQAESNYFNWMISSNDLLFISFEKLDMELKRGERAQGDQDNFDINSNLAANVYDMIGLVDSVSVVTNYENSQCFVEVTGRDLMKLLIEDGSFFFNPSITSGVSGVFANDKTYGVQGDVRDTDYTNGKYTANRLRLGTQQIDLFIGRQNQNIDYIIKGVISQLANIEIVPGYVFDSWGNDRTKFNEFESEIVK